MFIHMSICMSIRMSIRMSILSVHRPHHTDDVIAIIPKSAFCGLVINVDEQHSTDKFWKLTTATMTRLCSAGFGVGERGESCGYIVRAYTQEGTDGKHRTLTDMQ